MKNGLDTSQNQTAYSLHGRVNNNDPVKDYWKLSYLLIMFIDGGQKRPFQVSFYFHYGH